MAGMVKIEADKLESSVGMLTKTLNEELIQKIVSSFKIVKENADDSIMVNNLLEGFKETESQYNNGVEVLGVIVDNMKATCDVGDYFKKKSAGEVEKQAIADSASKIDAGAFA